MALASVVGVCCKPPAIPATALGALLAWRSRAVTTSTVGMAAAASAAAAAAAAAPRLTPEAIIAMPTALVELAKRAAARQAVDEYVASGMAVGVGSGSTIVYAIQRLAERVRDDGLSIVCVPTSFQSKVVRTRGLTFSRPSTIPSAHTHAPPPHAQTHSCWRTRACRCAI